MIPLMSRLRQQLCVADYFGLAATLALSVFLAGCGSQRIREQADELTRAGRYDEAIRTLHEGEQKYPDDATLRAGMAETRERALAELLGVAQRLRAQDRLPGALEALQRAEAIASADERVAALRRDIEVQQRQDDAARSAEAAEASNPDEALRIVTESLKDNDQHAGLLRIKHRLEVQSRQAQLNHSHLGLAENRPISLDFRDADLRTVLGVITRNCGVNFVLSNEIKPDIKVTIYLRSARLEDALDLITGTNQLAKKILDERTVFIYPNTPDKQHEFQEQVVKVFYLVGGHPRGAADFLKSMLKVKEPFVDERANMIALRESPENIALAERLIPLYDAQEPEVLLNVEIAEIDTTRLTNLGVQFPETLSLTPLSIAGKSSLTLADLRGLSSDRIGITTPSITLNLQRQVGDVNMLANPSIRARNREKAHILIGDKVPIITATVGTNGFVTDSVSYQDVGLKLEVQPTIYPDDEVVMNIALEVSTLGTQVQTSNGTTAYQISTRNAGSVLRLHDGESQLLAGLINREDSSNSTRLPGLGDFPVLGHLFRSQNDNSQKTELVLSITPHVLHNVRRADATETELWVGTDTAPRLQPVGGRPVPVAASAGKPLTRPTAPAASVTDGSPAPVAPDDSRAGQPKASLVWRTPETVRAGQVFTLKLAMTGSLTLHTLPLTMILDNNLLQIVSAEPAAGGDAKSRPIGFSKQVDVRAGLVRMNALYGGSVRGDMAIADITVKALRPGQALVRMSHEALENGVMLDMPEALQIEITP